MSKEERMKKITHIDVDEENKRIYYYFNCEKCGKESYLLKFDPKARFLCYECQLEEKNIRARISAKKRYIKGVKKRLARDLSDKVSSCDLNEIIKILDKYAEEAEI